MNGQTNQGMGCFAKGCLTVLIAGVLLAIIGGAGGWYFYSKLLDRFTSAERGEIQIAPPTETQYQAAEASLNRLREAAQKGEETTVEFTATDLNALIARHPDFAGARGKTRIGIANSEVALDISAPLDSVGLPKLKNRWFNGTVRFAVGYADRQFTLALRSAEVGGHYVPRRLLRKRFTSSFNESFTKSFRNSLETNPQAAAFWKQVKTISVQDDKLIVTTYAGQSRS